MEWGERTVEGRKEARRMAGAKSATPMGQQLGTLSVNGGAWASVGRKEGWVAKTVTC